MVKKILLGFAMLGIATICIGWTPKYNVSYVPVIAGHGGTYWEMAEHFYQCNEFYPLFAMSTGEYSFNIEHDAKNAKLTANGRVLQPSDIVYVPIYKRVK